jgi:hypothetical protein
LPDEHPSSERGPQYAAVAGKDWRNLPVNLAEDEAPNGPGHAIRKHVGKTEAERLGEFEQDNRYGFFYDEIRKREGSFDSIENANDLTNQTLRANSEQVDRVASGQVAKAYIQYRFGFVTGYEVIRTDPDYPEFETRNTYGVGLVIVHDPSSPRGFRVISAFPRNFD